MARCFICDSVLEHQQTDMAADYCDGYDGDGEALIKKYRCPKCGRDYEVCDPTKEERDTVYKEYWHDSTD